MARSRSLLGSSSSLITSSRSKIDVGDGYERIVDTRLKRNQNQEKRMDEISLRTDEQDQFQKLKLNELMTNWFVESSIDVQEMFEYTNHVVDYELDMEHDNQLIQDEEHQLVDLLKFYALDMVKHDDSSVDFDPRKQIVEI